MLSCLVFSPYKQTNTKKNPRASMYPSSTKAYRSSLAGVQSHTNLLPLPGALHGHGKTIAYKGLCWGSVLVFRILYISFYILYSVYF